MFFFFLDECCAYNGQAKINSDFLGKAHGIRTLFATMNKRQISFFGYKIRRETLENILTTGKINDRSGRGRPREMILEKVDPFNYNIVTALL